MNAVDEETLDRNAKGLYLGEKCSSPILGGQRTRLQEALPASFDLRLDIQLLDDRLPLWFWRDVVVWQHDVVQGECWSWRRPLDLSGFGLVTRSTPLVHAHRIAWEALVAPIPNGMFLDHLCLNRSCVRPLHLEFIALEQNPPSRLGLDRMAAARIRSRSAVRKARKSGKFETGCRSKSPTSIEEQSDLFGDRAQAGASRKSHEGSVLFGDPRLPKRYWRSVLPPEVSNECWEWIGSRTRMGYGRILWDGAPWAAHRVAYEVLVEPIPEGHDVHHKCKNTGCVRPDHLMAVTRREHLQLDGNPIMQKSEQTHCIRGHAFTARNTSIKPGGTRACRRCAADRALEIRARDPEARRERERLYMREYRRRKAEAAAAGKPFADERRKRSRD